VTATLLDRETLEAQYNQVRPKYEKLQQGLQRDLLAALHHAGVSLLNIESRVKDFDSLWIKLQRKGYPSPLHDAKDLCGLRVICYYTTDVDRARKAIQNELDVLESFDKADLLQPAEFGYLSYHLIATPTQDMLDTVSYRGLDGLVAEIQVRTLLQHAWAELSHELSYKRREHVPAQFQRHLYQLQAILENLDAQFDQLRRQKSAYVQQILRDAQQAGHFDLSQDLNMDTLQAFLDFHFPERQRDRDLTQQLLNVLIQYHISLPQLGGSLNTLVDYLPALDRGVYGTIAPTMLSQYLAMRAVLEITNDDIYAAAPPIAKWTRVIDYWRRQLSSPNRT
jgi:putative GTP pyrophosphokinase